MELEILEFPDPRLRTEAKEVTEVTDETRELIDSMFEKMYESNGIGLAATQVNHHQQIFVMDLSATRNEQYHFINPKITHFDGETRSQEGCLSVPETFESVDRAEYIKVEAIDRDGNSFELEADGLMAICIQHECEHLQGKLFIDKLSSLKRGRIRKKLEKAHKIEQR